jgi:hypothetical protein
LTLVKNPDPDPGFGIQCLFDPWIRDPKRVKIGIRIRDEQSGSYFRELRNNFLGLNTKFFDADTGFGMEKIGIRDPKWNKFGSVIQDTHPGSATPVFNYP